MSFTLKEIQAEAKKQLKIQAETEAAEKRLAAQQALQETLRKEELLRHERLRLLAEEEQIRIRAQQLVIDAEAKRLAESKEAAIQAELERLKNRTPLEVFEDRLNDIEESLKAKIESNEIKALEKKICMLKDELETQRQQKQFILKTTQESIVELHTQISDLQRKTTTDDLKKHFKLLEQFVLNFTRINLNMQTPGNAWQAAQHNYRVQTSISSLLSRYQDKLQYKKVQRKLLWISRIPYINTLATIGRGSLNVKLNNESNCIEVTHCYYYEDNKTKNDTLASIPFSTLGIQYEKDKLYTLLLVFKSKTFQISTPEIEGEEFGYGTQILKDKEDFPLESIIVPLHCDVEEVFD